MLFYRHDHLYNTISTKVIQSSAFREIKKNPSPLLGCKVILCTLSMLSNHLITTFTSKVPINYLVVDEASQIKVSDYISPLEKFSSIKKLCFIGDDKQCELYNFSETLLIRSITVPPYNQGEVKEIQSIFEISHLRSKALLLDIQCKCIYLFHSLGLKYMVNR